MTVDDRKRTEQVKLMLTEKELLDLTRVANTEDRSLSEFIRLTLRVALYGKVSRLAVGSEGTDVDQQSM